MERAAIAAATKIKFPQQQLLQLIHEHLAASGLTGAAAALEREVELHPPHVHAAPRLTALPDAGTGLLKGKGREATQAAAGAAARVRAESGGGGVGGGPGTPARARMSIALTNSAMSVRAWVRAKVNTRPVHFRKRPPLRGKKRSNDTYCRVAMRRVRTIDTRRLIHVH